MTKGQIITLTFITILFGVANLQDGIGQGIFGAILGFAITYGIIYWINKRKAITPEEREKRQTEKAKKIQQKQQLKQKKAQAKLELQKTKLKEKEIKHQRIVAEKKVKAEKSKIRERSIPAPASTLSSSEQKLMCPYCGSTNIQPLGQHKKGFSVGKAVGGVVLTGGVGALAGFAGKKTKQTDFVCMTCGKQFKK